MDRNPEVRMDTNANLHSQCPFCSVQCKLQIEKKRTEREEVLPVSWPVQDAYEATGRMNQASEGRLCIKGMYAHQHAWHEQRVKQPLLKTEAGFKPITWSEALTIIRSRWNELQQTDGRDAIGVYGGGSLTNESAYLLGKFARLALRTRYIDYNGRFCMSAAASAAQRAFGMDRGLTNPLSDIPFASCIVLAGTNIAECQPTLLSYFQRAKAKGAYIIVIDPRVTKTADLADLHLKIRPGSDAILLNGWLKWMVDQQWVDASFVAKRTEGFTALKDFLEGVDLQEVERLTDVPLQQIKLASERFARARTGMIFTARGVEQQVHGYETVRNFLNVLLLTGKIGRMGCGYGAVTGQGNGQGGREHGQKADQLPGYRSIEHESDRATIAKVWGIDADLLPRKGVSAYEMMLRIQEGEIRSLFVMGSNPVVSNPNARLVERALRKLDFLVVADFCLSETAELADLVLPSAPFLENEGTMTNLEGRVLLREAATPLQGESKQDWRILTELGRVLGAESYFDYASAEQIFEELRVASQGGLADYAGITYARLRKEEGVYWPCPDPSHPGERRLFAERFARDGGRAELLAVAHPRLPEEPCSDYPLYLTTGRVLTHYLTGVQTRGSYALKARELDAYMEVHPSTGREYGLTDGGWVKLSSRRGDCVLRARFSDSIRKDTVFVPMHWGGYQNVNRLTLPELDPTCKMPGFKACAVQVSALLAGDFIQSEQHGGLTSGL
ncbi:assimilatory nitrate reductase catalytic subunit NasC [Marinicrinis sediminis]|uniref:Molybdopterin oxidoreductase family protein n=1 Tax=Marinicrinis sediminis TaxID=1652465 RepID=A0ABW5R5S1_9BACL